MSAQKWWKVPVVWSMMGHLEVEAETEAEALQRAKELSQTFPLPDAASYLEDSFEVDEDGCITEL